jgi:hypothetical protein
MPACVSLAYIEGLDFNLASYIQINKLCMPSYFQDRQSFIVDELSQYILQVWSTTSYSWHHSAAFDFLDLKI